MLSKLVAAAVIFAACGTYGWLLFQKYKRWRIEDRFAALLIPFFMSAVLINCAATVTYMPSSDWNGCRLAPSVSLLRGYHLYYDANSGPILDTIYGPVMAVLCTSAALAKTPTGAILLTGPLNVLLMVVPLFLLLVRESDGSPRQWLLALAGFTFAACSLFVMPGTHYMISMIHTDSCSVGLGLLACLVLMKSREAPSQGRMALCAALAVLSVWSKQIEAPLLIALAVSAALMHGTKSLFSFVTWLVFLGGIISFIFFASFGFENSVFNILVIPSRHPWVGGKIGLLWAGRDLATKASFFALIALAGIMISRSISREKGEDWREWMRNNRWAVLVLAALFLVPTGCLGKNKFGGEDNSYHSLYYLIAACSAVLVRLASQASPEKLRRPAAQCLYCVAFGACCLALPQQAALDSLIHPWANPQEEAYQFARAHPGEAYFPRNTLSSLMAEGKLYHFEYGVLDRRLAGFTPTDEHYRAFIPASMRYVMYDQNPHIHFTTLEFLPEFNRRIELKEMPGWIVYAKSQDGQ